MRREKAAEAPSDHGADAASNHRAPSDHGAPSNHDSDVAREAVKPEGPHGHEAGAAHEAKGGHGDKPAHGAVGGHGETPAKEADAGEGAAEHSFDAAMYLLPPGEKQPWRIFRHLQQAQDRIVAGEPGGSLPAVRDRLRGMVDR